MSILWKQSGLATLLLAIVFLTWAASSFLAVTSSVISDHVIDEEVRHRTTNGVYFYDGGFIDEGDFVLLKHIPHGNFSRGGVYFIGSSEMRASIMTLDLSNQENELIHNYAISDLRHSEIEYYVRILSDEAGIFWAGGIKNTFILSSFVTLARPKDIESPHTQYVRTLFERHGFYDYDWKKGIRQRDVSAVEKFYRIERDRANRFLTIAFNARESRVRPVMSMEWRREHIRDVMGDDWRPVMLTEIAAFERTIDYLRARGARVVVLRPPMGSWYDEVPYEAAYREVVAPMLASRGVPVVDYSDFLADNEFGDDVHPRYSGQMRLHAAYRQLALEQLAIMNIPLNEKSDRASKAAK